MENQSCPSQVQGSQDQHSQRLRAENQELRARMGTMETQMAELKKFLLTLKGRDTSEGAVTTVAGANPGDIPSVTTEPMQITLAENNEEKGVHCVQVPNPVQGRQAVVPQAKDKYQLSEEGLKAIEEAIEAPDPSLVPSPTSEVLNLVKFEGTTCPAAHATMYHEGMFSLTKDDRLLTYYFRSSLAGEALSWYMQEHSHTRCWKELVDAFLKRFNYNIGQAPCRTQLQSMAQRSKETFREYALRWKDLAAQVKPPLLKREMIDIFMNTLPPLYHDKLVEGIYANLEDLVLAEESLENRAKKRKIAYSSTEATPIAGPGNVPYSPKNLPQIPHSPPQTRKSQGTPDYPEKKRVQFDPIPMSYTDLFNYLYTHKVVSTRPMRPMQPPFFRGYNPNATCAFHEGAVGHCVETCRAFKLVVQDLIDSKSITFRQEDPDITTVKGSGAKKNEEISATADKGKAPQCDSAPMSYTALCSYLISHGWVTPRKMRPVQPPFPRGYSPEATCEFHLGTIGHSVENCPALRHLIQGLVDTNRLTFEKGEGSSSQGLWTIKQG